MPNGGSADCDLGGASVDNGKAEEKMNKGVGVGMGEGRSTDRGLGKPV